MSSIICDRSLILSSRFFCSRSPTTRSYLFITSMIGDDTCADVVMIFSSASIAGSSRRFTASTTSIDMSTLSTVSAAVVTSDRTYWWLSLSDEE